MTEDKVGETRPSNMYFLQLKCHSYTCLVSRMSNIYGTVARTSVRGLYVYLLYSINRQLPLDESYFSYHPNLFAFSIICFAEAYYCKQQLRPYNLKLNFDWRTKLHIAWAALGTYAADYGFYCIYVQKNLKQKDHFTSWHGKMGLLGRSPIMLVNFRSNAGSMIYSLFTHYTFWWDLQKPWLASLRCIWLELLPFINPWLK